MHYQLTLHFLVVFSTLLLLVVVVVEEILEVVEVLEDIALQFLGKVLVVEVAQKVRFQYQLLQVLIQ